MSPLFKRKLLLVLYVGGLEQWWRKFMASRTIQRAE